MQFQKTDFPFFAALWHKSGDEFGKRQDKVRNQPDRADSRA